MRAPIAGKQTEEIVRDSQNLPVPLGGFAPVHAPGPAHHPRFRRHLHGLALAAACIVGAAGVTLLVTRPAPSAYLRGDRLVVGAMVLHAVGRTGLADTLFGGDASYVLGDRHGDGSQVASAAWTSAQTAGSGRCVMHRDSTRLVDECSFTVASQALTSVDLLDPAAGHAWQRTYADGVRVTIDVPDTASAVPVPFPIGH